MASDSLSVTHVLPFDNIDSICTASDGQYIAVGQVDGVIGLISVGSGNSSFEMVATRKSHTSNVVSIAFSPSVSSLLSGSFDSSIHLHSLPSLELMQVMSGHRAWVNIVAYITENVAVSCGTDQAVRVWDLESSKCINSITRDGSVSAIALSPSSEIMACGGSGGKVAILTTSGLELISLISCGEHSIDRLVFLDADSLYIAQSVGPVLLLNIHTSAIMQTLLEHKSAIGMVVVEEVKLPLLELPSIII